NGSITEARARRFSCIVDRSVWTNRQRPASLQHSLARRPPGRYLGRRGVRSSRASKRADFHANRAREQQGPRGFGGRRASRQDVVDEADAALGCAEPRAERAANVLLAPPPILADLLSGRADAPEQRPHR